jgi:hypothetical protein
VVVVVVVTGTLVSTAGPAHADSNSVAEYLDALNHKIAYQAWSSSGNNGSVNPAMWQVPASGYCLDSWFDWLTPEGSSHFDARGSRTCDANTQSYQAFTESYNVNGMQKAGGAYGLDNATTSGTVLNYPGASASITTINVNMVSTNCSVRWWKRKNGVVTYGSGGSPTSSTC